MLAVKFLAEPVWFSRERAVFTRFSADLSRRWQCTSSFAELRRIWAPALRVMLRMHLEKARRAYRTRAKQKTPRWLASDACWPAHKSRHAWGESASSYKGRVSRRALFE